MSKKTKILLGSLMTLGTFATAVSTTYAFVVLNDEVKVEEFNFNLETDAGLLISTDGINFSQDITASQIQNVISNNTGVAYNNAKYKGVTLSQTDGKINFDNNGYPLFVKDKLTELPSPIGDRYYDHGYQAAANNDYIMFDLYFQLTNQGSITAPYSLSFMDITSIKSNGPIDYTLSNVMTTTTGTHASGDTITFDPVNAMRLGLKNHDTNKFTIYEPGIGLGSAAIEGSTEDIHNKDKNAMYTYYNSAHPREPFLVAASDGEAFDTISSFTDNPIGEFVYDNTSHTYNIIKITIAIWLEGWDADFFRGIPQDASIFDINLGFKLELI